MKCIKQQLDVIYMIEKKDFNKLRNNKRFYNQILQYDGNNDLNDMNFNNENIHHDHYQYNNANDIPLLNHDKLHANNHGRQYVDINFTGKGSRHHDHDVF